eukprot:scaffold89544_cov66-Phaeocystis_antarctica.AAC.1
MSTSGPNPNPTRALHTEPRTSSRHQRLTPHPQPTLRRSFYCSRPLSSPSQPPTLRRAAPRAPRPRGAASRQ